MHSHKKTIKSKYAQADFKEDNVFDLSLVFLWGILS